MSKQTITVWVPGTPAKKGSTRSFAHATTGRIITQAADKRLKSWESRVSIFVSQEWAGQPSDRPIHVHVAFFLPRAKNHYRTGKYKNLLKDSSPKLPYQGVKNDVDKLARAILDALTGVCYLDDCQVVMLQATKAWEKNGPGASITVMEA